MLKKINDVTDATIVAEVESPAAPVAAGARNAEPETLKPLAPEQQGLGQNQGATTLGGEVPTIKSRMQQAAAAAVLGAAQKAVNNAFRPRPNWAFATQSSAHLIALGFGSGLMRPAPGTWGTVFSWVTFNYLLAGLSSTTTGLIIAAAFAIGVWACGTAGKALGVIDHGAWVWDEVVAFWLVLWLIPAGFTAQVWGFVLFRFFDIVKPPPIRQWDAQLKSGFGVMWDDIMAAFYTLLVIALWVKVFG
jgi:phosphatidylglycerophosphatase A